MPSSLHQARPRRAFFQRLDIWPPLGRAWVCLGLALCLVCNSAGAKDTIDRRVTADQTPAVWQSAIVKLAIPLSRREGETRRHWVEDCTGTVIANEPLTVLTAWHCIDGELDLTRPPRVQIEQRWHPIRVLNSGGHMGADWALLQSDIDSPLAPISLASTAPAAGDRIVMAGFSMDMKRHNGGVSLSFDPDCAVMHYEQYWGVSTCQAQQGASGGPVLSLQDEQWTVVGVISARRRDSGETLFFPVTQLPRALLGTYQ